MATVADVASLAGVSPTTVSRVLNNHPHVTDETRSRVLSAMEQLGYQPSRVARRLRMETTQIIGLIISDIANPFFPSVVRGIEDVAYANECSLLLCNSDEDPAKEELYIKILLAEKVAGVIMSPTDEDCLTCNILFERGTPIVALDRRLRSLDVDTVVTANVQGAYEAVNHLIQLGHRRIGLISGPGHITTGRERQQGYQKALAGHDIAPDQDLIKVGDFKEDSGYHLALELLEMDDPPSAIFTANNLMTLGALNAIHERGLRIPNDVAIVGFDDMPWAPSLNPPLTAVAQPTYELGHIAAELLLERIKDNSRPTREIVLATSLVVRESCGSAQSVGRSPSPELHEKAPSGKGGDETRFLWSAHTPDTQA